MEYEIGQLVFHVGTMEKYKILRKINPSQYEIIDSQSNIFTEPEDCLLEVVENRNRIIKFIINEE